LAQIGLIDCFWPNHINGTGTLPVPNLYFANRHDSAVASGWLI
jgi:hypothetical protein